MKNLLKLTLSIIIVLAGSQLRAGIDEHKLASALQGFDANPATSYSLSPNYTTGLVFNSLQNYVYLKFEHDQVDIFTESFDVEVDVLITAHDQVSNTSNPLPLQTLKLHIDPSLGAVEDHLHAYKFTGADYFSFIIMDVRLTNTSNPVVWNDVKNHFNVNAGIIVDAYVPIDVAQTWDLAGGGFSLIQDPNVDDQLKFSWPSFTGAEEYQLEWAWYDDQWPSASKAPYLDINNDNVIDQEDIEVDFKFNSTRITTGLTEFLIPDVFPSGYIVWRVRALGYRTGVEELVPGLWTTDGIVHNSTDIDVETLLDFNNTYNTLSFKYHNTSSHESAMNWDYTLALAEDGKHKMVLNYYDGSYVSRQSITRQQNANGLNVVVGENIFDHLGRPAIQVLPVPVNSQSLDYRADFNVNASGVPYSFNDFAIPSVGCFPNGVGMSTTSGASKYYSDQNDFTGAIHRDLIPDAQEFPYAQTVFSNDHLGRVLKQSGVGPDHQIGTGHETTYGYAKPDQFVLDALFGNNAGRKKYYEKARVVDANGQTSVSIKDLRGNVVATYLVGQESENNLEDLPAPAGTLVTEQVENDNDNDHNSPVSELTVSTTIDVDAAQAYTFDYSFDPSYFQDQCEEESLELCFECVYKLDIQLIDAQCNNVLWQNSQITTIGTENEDCQIIAPATQTLSKSVFLEQGTYTLVKTLKLDETTLASYLQSYFEDNLCLYDFNDFLDETDVTNCDDSEIDCEECNEILSALTPGTDDHNRLSAFCDKLCEPETMCRMGYDQMLADVTPGGQYAQYEVTTSQQGENLYNAVDFEYSIFNNWNRLPNQALENGSGSTRYERLTYAHPIKSDPNLSYAYTVGGEKSLVKVGGSEYQPEQLSMKDFIENWEPEWAHTLVRFHPEYNYYIWCSEKYDQIAKDYKREFLEETDFDLANNQGLLDPLGMGSGNIPSGINPSDNDPLTTSIPAQDPFFTSDNQSAYFTPQEYTSYLTLLQGQFDEYYEYDDNGTAKHLNIWEFSALITAGLTFSEADGYDFTTANCDFDQFWTVFKSLYIQLRDDVANDLQAKYAFKYKACNACIGGELDADWAEIFQKVGPGASFKPADLRWILDYFLSKDPDQPCYAKRDMTGKKRVYMDASVAMKKMDVDLDRGTEDFLEDIISSSEEEVDAHCQSICEANVDIWMQKLGGCYQYMTSGGWHDGDVTYEAIKLALLDICEGGCGLENPFGAISDGNQSVNDILDQYLDFSSCPTQTRCEDCTELLLTSPYKGETEYWAQAQDREIVDPCGCNKVLSASKEWDERVAEDASYAGTLNEVFKELYGLTVDEISNVRCKCEEAFALTNNSCWDETAEWNLAAKNRLANSRFRVNPLLNCSECISCNEFNQTYYDFVEEYGSIETSNRFERLMSRYWNATFNSDWTYEDYEPYLDLCGTITPLVEERDHHTTGCNTLTVYGEKLKAFLQAVFTHHVHFAFQSVDIDLADPTTYTPYGLSANDFDNIIPPVGITNLKLEMRRGWNNTELNVRLLGLFTPGGTTVPYWEEFGSMYLELNTISPSTATTTGLADLQGGYPGIFSSLNFTPKFEYTSGSSQPTSLQFDFEVTYDMGGGALETLKFSGRNLNFNVSTCSGYNLVSSPLMVDEMDGFVVWQDQATQAQDCFCDQITDGYLKWQDAGNTGTFEDFLLQENNPPIVSLPDADKLNDYIVDKCCLMEQHAAFKTLAVVGECQLPNDYENDVNGNGEHSHGPTYDAMFADLLMMYGKCPPGGGSTPNVPCDLITEQVASLVRDYGNYSTEELNAMLSAQLGTNVRLVGGADATGHVDACLDCPRPTRMLCSESYEKEDYVNFLDVLLSKDYDDGQTIEPVFDKTMTSVSDFNTYLNPEFDIFSSRLNRSIHQNGSFIEYQKISESATELKMKVTYDKNTINEQEDIITLTTCCTTIDFDDIVKVIDLEPAELDNELMFYLKVDMGSCGVIRLKGTSTLFALNSCCEMGSDICFEDEIELEPCATEPTINALAKAARQYAQYKNQIEQDFTEAYQLQCFANQDVLSYTYNDYSHHYTLYYYDQANNLVQTVPPAGVNKLDQAGVEDVVAHRYHPTSYPATYPVHDLITYNEYNATGQVVKKTTPDEGTSELFYDDLGRLVASQNAKQALASDEVYSYTIYDELSRPIETGEKTGTLDMMHQRAATPNDPMISGDLADWYANGTRTEVTYTVYNEPKAFNDADDISEAFPNNVQMNLINRVVCTYTSEIGNPNERDFATHYSYDLTGNVTALVQDIGELAAYDNQFKLIENDYDLVSGNVNQVWYQKGKADQFTHLYQYDAEHRLISTKTSEDGIFWELDATYQFYTHGLLARTILGDLQVQGVDNAYNLQGWIKSVNADFLQASHDPGQDGVSGSGTAVARDAMGFSLGYYDGDYTGIGTTSHLSSGTGTVGNDLYNGNIKHMVTAIEPFTKNGTASPMLQEFGYDQLNRIVKSESYEDMNIATQTWPGSSALSAFKVEYSCDANGNLLTLKRNGNGISGGNYLMDDLAYTYNAGTNQLAQVVDAQVDPNRYDNDFDGSANYVYDAIGNLVEDPNEEILSIDWTVYGKVKAINRTSVSDKADLDFEYGAAGNRSVKRVKSGGHHENSYEYYVRDAGGNVMATYNLRANKDLPDDFMNYEDLNSELIGEKSEPVFITFLQSQFVNDADFKDKLKAQLLAHDVGYDFLAQYTPTDLYNEDATFYEDLLEGYPTTDLIWLTYNADKNQTVDDLYSCDGQQLLQAILTSAKTDFITTVENWNPSLNTALCQLYHGGPCPNGAITDLSTVSAATLAADYFGQPAADVKNALVSTPTTTHRNAINNHLSTNWLTDQIQTCGTTSTYLGYMDNDAVDARTHLVANVGYADIIDRLMTADINDVISKVVQLNTGYDFVANAMDNMTTMDMDDYHAKIISHWDQKTLDDAIDAMDALVTDYRLALTLNEHHLYGANRLGVEIQNLDLWWHEFTGSFNNGLHDYTANTTAPTGTATVNGNFSLVERGNKSYELANHLGNVLAVISDRKLSTDDDQDDDHDYYKAEVLSAQYYYPFGSEMPGRTYKLEYKESVHEAHDFSSSLGPWYPTGTGTTTSFANGRLKLTSTNGTILYNMPTEIGKTYKVVLKIDKGNTNSLRLQVATLNPWNEFITQDGVDGEISFTFTAEGTSTRIRIIRQDPASEGVKDFYLEDFVVYELYNLDKVEYRYGFQSQEMDNEIKGRGNSLNYTFRMHDPRIGRFFAVDPLAPKYPHYSPYMFSGNRVINSRELEGLEEYSSYEAYKMHQGDNAMAEEDLDGTNGVWFTADREAQNDRWSSAMMYITQHDDASLLEFGYYIQSVSYTIYSDDGRASATSTRDELAMADPFARVKGYYIWAQGQMDANGYGSKWAKGAMYLVDELESKASLLSMYGTMKGELLIPLNVGIADYAVSRYHEVLVDGNLGVAADGDWYAWDYEFIQHEQGVVARDIYARASRKAIRQMNRLSSQEGEMIFSGLFSKHYFPDFDLWSEDIISITASYNPYYRIHIPMLMLYTTEHIKKQKLEYTNAQLNAVKKANKELNEYYESVKIK